jgi:3-phenylpropionate/trans-cinnamate dioxygenase ferredoxin component
MSEFVEVAKVAEIPDPGKEIVEVDDRVVVLVHTGGQFYCVDDLCSHDGGTLGDGDLEDHCLVCPRHGAKFDVRDGSVVAMPATTGIPAHEVKVENGVVYVRINDDD